MEKQRAAIAVVFFKRESKYFPVQQPALLNSQVDELDALLDTLIAASVDPEANRVEL